MDESRVYALRLVELKFASPRAPADAAGSRAASHAEAAHRRENAPLHAELKREAVTKPAAIRRPLECCWPRQKKSGGFSGGGRSKKIEREGCGRGGGGRKTKEREAVAGLHFDHKASPPLCATVRTLGDLLLCRLFILFYFFSPPLHMRTFDGVLHARSSTGVIA